MMVMVGMMLRMLLGLAIKHCFTSSPSQSSSPDPTRAKLERSGENEREGRAWSGEREREKLERGGEREGEGRAWSSGDRKMRRRRAVDIFHQNKVLL